MLFRFKRTHSTFSWCNYSFANRIRKMISFELSKEIEKEVFSSCHGGRGGGWKRNKEKFWVPMRNRTSDLWIPRSNGLTLSHRDSMVIKAHYEVHIWHPSCIQLRSAMSIASKLLMGSLTLNDDEMEFYHGMFELPSNFNLPEVSFNL